MSSFKRMSGIGVVAGCTLVILVTNVASSSAALAVSLTPLERLELWLGIADETDVTAPVDYGPGRGGQLKTEGVTQTMAAVPMATLRSASKRIPTGTSRAGTTGVFGPAIAWPIIPIHVVLLPDGRVMDYGTSASGAQGAQFIYDVWDPTLGTGANAHVVLPNKTNTDLFCSTQSVMLSGEVLTSGGDLTIEGKRGSAQNNTTIFSPSANTLTANTPMSYARWYGSLVSLSNGQLAIFGGRQNLETLAPAQTAITPERYDPASRSWTSLTGATSTTAFGTADWYYPRSYVAPGGKVFVLSHLGQLYYVSTAGLGTITRANAVAPIGHAALPTIPFAPGRALSLRLNRQVVVIDYRSSAPVVTTTDDMDLVRYWASGSIMADGRVLVTGGSQVPNVLTGVAYTAQIWDPGTGHWTAGATATKPRLYHSNSMLLPDATVLTGGGGAPGPVNNLNAEIFYPPYLYTAEGEPAVRPVIASVASVFLNPGDTLNFTVGPTDTISQLTFIRTGSATHSNNSDQRFLDLNYQQEGQNVTSVLPKDTTIMVPGYYMVFAFNSAGVPSIARIVKVM